MPLSKLYKVLARGESVGRGALRDRVEPKQPLDGGT